MLTLAAILSDSAAGFIAAQLPRIPAAPLAYVPAVDESLPAAETAAAAASPLTDPVVIALVFAIVFFLLSWRISGGKKPE